jgi:hypothetical protein
MKKYILNSIDSWEHRFLHGNYWWDTENYTKQYCLTQIEYFKNMLKNIK